MSWAPFASSCLRSDEAGPLRIGHAEVRALAILLTVLLVALHVAHATALRNVLASFVALWVLVRVLSDGARSPLAWPVSAWLAWGAMSSLWSLDWEASVKSTIYDMVMPIGAFYGTYLVSRTGAAFRLLLFGVVAGMSILAVLVLLAVFNGQFEFLLAHEPAGLLYLYPGPGATSTLGIFALPHVLLLCWSERRENLRLAIALLACIAIAGLGSQNRMFWPAAVITIAVFYLCQWSRLSLLQRKRLRLAGYASVVAAVGIVAGLSEARTQGFEARLQGWAEWTAVAAEKPWIGYGLGKRVLGEVGPERLTEAMRRTDEAFTGHAHNLLLNTTLQVGVVGLAWFLFLIGSLGKYGYARKEGRALPESAALLALLVAMLVKNASDDFMDHAVIVAFWAHAGMLLGRLSSSRSFSSAGESGTSASHPR